MRLSARFLVLVAAIAIAASTAHASTTDITFGSAPGSTVPFTSYTQAGTNFTVTQDAGQFFFNGVRGNPAPGLTAGNGTKPSAELPLRR